MNNFGRWMVVLVLAAGWAIESHRTWAGDLTPEQLALLDETGSLSVSIGDTKTIEVKRIAFTDKYFKTQTTTSVDGSVQTFTTVLSRPDPFAALHFIVQNNSTAPAEVDAFATMPILPIVGAIGAPPQLLSRMDLILSDTGGAPGASVAPLFFPRIFEGGVQELELGGQAPLNVSLGTAITALGLTSLTATGIAPNPATDPTVGAWNYLVPFLNLRLSAGDKVEIFAFLGIAEQGQPQHDPAAVFAELAAVPEPSALVLSCLAGLGLALAARMSRRRLVAA